MMKATTLRLPDEPTQRRAAAADQLGTAASPGGRRTRRPASPAIIAAGSSAGHPDEVECRIGASQPARSQIEQPHWVRWKLLDSGRAPDRGVLPHSTRARSSANRQSGQGEPDDRWFLVWAGSRWTMVSLD